MPEETSRGRESLRLALRINKLAFPGLKMGVQIFATGQRLDQNKLYQAAENLRIDASLWSRLVAAFVLVLQRGWTPEEAIAVRTVVIIWMIPWFVTILAILGRRGIVLNVVMFLRSRPNGPMRAWSGNQSSVMRRWGQGHKMRTGTLDLQSCRNVHSRPQSKTRPWS